MVLAALYSLQNDQIVSTEMDNIPGTHTWTHLNVTIGHIVFKSFLKNYDNSSLSSPMGLSSIPYHSSPVQAILISMSIKYHGGVHK